MTSPQTVTGADEIAAAFNGHGKAAALMPYVMGGYPNIDLSRAIGEACIESGGDLIELGVPYSDPLADGPVIHAAGTQALQQGVTLADVLQVGRALTPSVPVVLMTYANVVLAHGPERFADKLRSAGISGAIVPDIPLEEAEIYLEAFGKSGLALVPLVAPTTPDERMKEIGARAQGFLYAVAVKGTTGERKDLDPDVGKIIQRARHSTEVPIALGFGISTPEHARQAADLGAQGVIVASRLIREAGEADDPSAAVGAIVRGLADALEA